MASEIQSAGLTSRLVSKYGIKGRFRPRLDDMLVPVVLADDLTADRETVDPGQYVEHFNIAAAAAESGIIQFAGAPNFLMLPREVYIRPAASLIVRVQVDNAAVAPAFTGTSSTRGVEKGEPFGPGAPVAVTGGTFAFGGLGGQLVAEYTIDTLGRTIDLTGFQLANGERLYLFATTNNVTMRFNPTWTYKRDE